MKINTKNKANSPRYFVIFASIISILFLNSCTTKKMYSGPALSKNDVATLLVPAPLRVYLRSGSEPDRGIGSPLIFYDDKVELMPGLHKVEVYPGRQFYSKPITLNFKALAGHTYKVMEKKEQKGLFSNSFSWKAWIELKTP